MYKVTGCQLKTEDAVLKNYSRYLVEDTCYPGITKNKGRYINGKFYSEVSQTAFKALDDFEGKLYQRIEVEIVTEFETLRAQTFAIAPKYEDRLSNQPWSPSLFRKKHFDTFIQDIKSEHHKRNSSDRSLS
tara:strand:- start:111 stop:503 length:393 start_codon:yes stop_codon:yes gene_type:complete